MKQSNDKVNLTAADRYRAMRQKLFFNQNLLDFIEIFLLMFIICNAILLGSAFVTKGYSNAELLFTVHKGEVTKKMAQSVFINTTPEILKHCENAFFKDDPKSDHSIQSHIYSDNSVFELTIKSLKKIDRTKLLELSKIVPETFEKNFLAKQNKANELSLDKKNNYRIKLAALIREYPDFFRYLLFEKLTTSSTSISLEEALALISEKASVTGKTTEKALKEAIKKIDSKESGQLADFHSNTSPLLKRTAQLHSMYSIIGPIYNSVVKEGIKEETARFNRILKKHQNKCFYMSSMKITNNTLKGHLKKYFVRFASIALFLSLLIFPIVNYSGNSGKK